MLDSLFDPSEGTSEENIMAQLAKLKMSRAAQLPEIKAQLSPAQVEAEDMPNGPGSVDFDKKEANLARFSQMDMPNGPGSIDFDKKEANLARQMGTQQQNASGPEMGNLGKAKSAALQKLSQSNLMPDMEQSPIQSAEPLDMYGSDLNDAALKEAQERGNQQRQMGGIMRAVETLGQGFTEGRVKADNSFADALDKQAGQGVTDITDRRNAKDKDASRQRVMAELQDENLMRDPNSDISKGLRDGIKALYPALNLPDNISALQLKASGISMGTLITAKEFADSRRDSASQRNFEMSEARQDKKDKLATLTEDQVKDVGSYDKALGAIDEILSEKTRLGVDTGKLSFGMNRVASFVGMDDAEKSGFKADVGSQLAEYIKSISGAGVSNKERAFLLEIMPSVYDNDDQFTAKLNRVRARIQRNRGIELSGLRNMGKNVTKWEPKVTSEAGPKESKATNNDSEIEAWLESNKDSPKYDAVLKKFNASKGA